MDATSRELGRIAGAQEGILENLRHLNTKMDQATEDRGLLFAEMRTLKHDQRNTELNVQAATRRLETIEQWQQRMIGRVSAFGIVGAVAGWVLIHFAFPIIARLWR